MTIEQIEEFLKNKMGGSPLFATQQRISGPKIVRNLERLANGDVPPPINVIDDLIIEGHHRYLAGNIFGVLPDTQPGGRPRDTQKILWGQVVVDTTDWDNPA